MAGRVLLAAVRLRLGNAPPNDRTVVETTAKNAAKPADFAQPLRKKSSASGNANHPTAKCAMRS